MGNPKQRWTPDEEDALVAGIRKHGPGKWKAILIDPEFRPMLLHRSNVDLKDKWRNMPAQCLRDYSMTPNRQTTVSNITAPKPQKTPVTTSNTKVPSASSRHVKQSPVMYTSTPDSPYYTMIFEALSPSNSPRGSEFGAIAGFIEQKCEVPHNFRKLLTSELKKLVSQGKIERVRKRYQIKEVTLSTTFKTPEQKDVGPTPVELPASTISPETLEDAAKMAAYEIAESENKALEAAKAVKEYERISQMVAEADAMLILCQEVFEHQVRPL